MCVTEVWSYRECGCFYNHSVICRTHRNQPTTPCFAPNIQYPVERWLQDATLDADKAYRQYTRQAMPTEPEDCPDHRTVQKSFLNQICEDCLLAETQQNSNLNQHALVYPWPRTILNHGEGLIWDSEVKVEIECDTPVSPTQSSLPDSEPGQQPTPVEDDIKIYESHVEITIESRSRSGSAGPRSPSQTWSHDGIRPPSSTSSLGTSPPHLRCNSPSVLSHKHSPKLYHGLDDGAPVADIPDRRAKASPRDAQLSNRGRPLARSNLCKVEKCETETEILSGPIVSRRTHKKSFNLQGLRAISTTFIPSKAHSTGDEKSPSDEPHNSLRSFSSGTKIPFRTLRRRKSSPLMLQSASSWPAPSSIEAVTTAHNPGTEKARPLLSRKSTLKDRAVSLMRDLKRTKATRSLPGSQCNSAIPSPTSVSFSGIVDGQSEGGSARQRLGSFCDTVYEEDSSAARLDHSELESAQENAQTFLDNIIPDMAISSSMDTLRAVLNDLNMALEKDDTAATSASHLIGQSNTEKDHPADIGELDMFLATGSSNRPQFDCPKAKVHHGYIPFRSSSLPSRGISTNPTSFR